MIIESEAILNLRRSIIPNDELVISCVTDRAATAIVLNEIVRCIQKSGREVAHYNIVVYKEVLINRETQYISHLITIILKPYL